MRRRHATDRFHFVEMRAHPVHLPVADNQLAPAHHLILVVIAAR